MASIPLPALSVRAPQQPDMLGTFGRLLQFKNMAQERQLQQVQLAGAQQQLQSGALDLKQKQTTVDDDAAVKAAIAEAGGDPRKALPKIMEVAPNIGLQYHKAIQEWDNLSTDGKIKKLDLHLKQVQGLGQLAGNVTDQQSRDAALQQAVESGLLEPEAAQQIASQPFDPSQPEQWKQSALTAQQQIENARQKIVDKQNTDKATAELEKTKAETANLKDGGTQASADAKYRTIQAKLAQKQPVTADDKAFVSAYEKQKTLNTQVQINAGSNLTATARDQAAEKYWATGQMPPLSRGVAGMKQSQAIMNRAAELHPTGSLSANSAEFKANQESLSKIQTNFDQVSAFESTAGKNLDLFLKTADKVSDTGAKFLNTPLRAIQRGMMGTADMAAFDAARTTALTEISKVLNSSNANGVLSDSARKEVEGLIGKNATLASIKSAAKILKQDMANRHESYQQQIEDIKGRLGGAPDATPKTNQTTMAQAAPTGATHTGIGSQDKKKHWLDASGKDLGLAE